MEETEYSQEIFGRIYKISSAKCDGCYIGVTTQTLRQRFADHRCHYRKYLEGKIGYATSYEVVKHNDAKMELLFEGLFPNKFALFHTENEYIKAEPKALNIHRSEKYCERSCKLCGGTFAYKNRWNHNTTKRHQDAERNLVMYAKLSQSTLEKLSPAGEPSNSKESEGEISEESFYYSLGDLD